jgi:hypothetical protein
MIEFHSQPKDIKEFIFAVIFLLPIIDPKTGADDILFFVVILFEKQEEDPLHRVCI